MKRLAFVAAAMLTGLAACSQGASNATNAVAANPAPAVGGTYQMDVVSGLSQVSEVVVRMNTATGQAMLSSSNQPFIHIAEPTQPPAGSYHLSHYASFDSNQSTRTWDLYRIESGSGRIWYLNYDGQSAASWAEIATAP